MLLIRLKVLFVLAFALTASRASGECTFPGVAHRCDAPQGETFVEWREPVAGGQHQLWLHQRPGEAVKILDFGRHVRVLWAPGGRRFAVTDRHGSNDSSLWVVAVTDPVKLVNIESEFLRTFGRMPALYEHGHRYFEAGSWSSPTRLRFRVRAFDAAPRGEYQGRFMYDTSAGVSKEP